MVTRIKSPKAEKLRRKKKRRSRMTWLGVLVCAVVLYGASSLMDWMPMPEPELNSGRTVQVYNMETGELMALDVEQYLTGVVAAEMPASFDEEALKAQAVAARTFTVSRMISPNPKVQQLHSLAQLSTSPETCQAWISEEEQKSRWGRNYRRYHRKIVQAVADTAGEVLRYDGILIEPVYHASCGGGFTEAAENVWGSFRPYLSSVECNHADDPHTRTKTSMTMAAMAQKLQLPDAVPAAASGDYIQLISSTASSRVQKIQIGGKTFSGAELREALHLKSSLISWQIDGDEITFITNGYGHGVGMCQYGADYYAKQGNDYRQILNRYYPGAQLSLE